MNRIYLLRSMSVLLVVLCATSPLLAHAQTWDLPQLMAELAQVQSHTSSYTEKKTLALLKAPAESSGMLNYRRPDHVEKHVLLPKDESISVDGDELTWSDGATGRKRHLRVQSNAVLAALVVSIRATLAGDLPALQHYFAVKLDGTPAHWELTLTPADDAMRRSVQTIRMAGNGNQVAVIDILETGGDRSVMTIHD